MTISVMKGCDPMTVLVMKKDNFNTVTLNNVSSISYASEIFTIISDGNTYTYAKADYNICILW